MKNPLFGVSLTSPWLSGFALRPTALNKRKSRPSVLAFFYCKTGQIYFGANPAPNFPVAYSPEKDSIRETRI